MNTPKIYCNHCGKELSVNGRVVWIGFGSRPYVEPHVTYPLCERCADKCLEISIVPSDKPLAGGEVWRKELFDRMFSK